MKLYKTPLYLLLLFCCLSCNKLVDIAPPKNQLSPEKIFDNTSSAIAATVNIYTVLGTVESNFITPIGTYTDEFITTTVDPTSSEFTNGSLTSANSRVLSIWQNLYATIYKANATLEGLTLPSAIPDSIKAQCIGEAKFLRAYSHFMLVNIYGDIPLIISTDVTKNSSAARTPSDAVYQEIISDLKDAAAGLKMAYPAPGEKIRANKGAAQSLLAKVLLFSGDYGQAEDVATQVIGSGQYSLTANLNSIFLINSSETIFQLWKASGFTTLNSVPASGIPATQVTTNLMNAFEGTDQRKTAWIKSTLVSGKTYYYPFKYKQRATTTGTNSEYSMYMRLAEIYLIRAEARARLGKMADALSDLNKIRNRAGLASLAGTSQQDLLNAILHERQIELFNEGGNRFFDLKRFGLLDQINKPLKPLWQSSARWLPIPRSELLTNPFLTQNPGYSN